VNTTDQLIHRLHQLTEELSETLGRLDDLIGPRFVPVGHIDDTPVRPLTHCRHASDLVGNELVERRPGEWARLVEVVEVGHPSGDRVGCVFEDGLTVWVAPDSSVKVRHDPFHPAVMREGLAAAREALRSSAPQGAA
jgi:hypothetical protein